MGTDHNRRMQKQKDRAFHQTTSQDLDSRAYGAGTILPSLSFTLRRLSLSGPMMSNKHQLTWLLRETGGFLHPLHNLLPIYLPTKSVPLLLYPTTKPPTPYTPVNVISIIHNTANGRQLADQIATTLHIDETLYHVRTALIVRRYVLAFDPL